MTNLEWVDQSLCSELVGENPNLADLWFSLPHTEEANAAKAVCFQCPVQKECLAFARSTEATNGIWGGHHFDDTPDILEIDILPP